MTPGLPENWQELIAGYALGDLSPDEAEELQRLLTENPDLSAEVVSFQEVLALMPYAIAQQDPPLPLRDKILTAAQALAPDQNNSQTHVQGGSAASAAIAASDPLPTRNRRRSVKAAYSEVASEMASEAPGTGNRRRQVAGLVGYGAIAAVTLLTLGFDNYRLRQENQNAQAVIAALQQRGTLTYALEGTEKADTASGSLVVSPSQQVIVVAKDLPVLPAGQVYRLWAMPPSGTNPTFCGQFNPGQAGGVSQWVAPGKACQSTTVQMLITSEQASDPPVPKGSLVMKSRI